MIKLGLKKIGFIGLGIMGKPMAMNLLKAGYPLTVWNRTRSKMDELVAMGAYGAESPKEVAEKSDVVITMVTDATAVEQVILGPNGVIHGARPGLIVIDMSTISPIAARRIARELEKKGVKMLDAPVSGGEKGAK
ncbi:NAD(P)-binding domain-containing protein, partial [Candidatus Bathyarchaeota archaeon]|nr:NAD(P)-binding domain-containing protein [Candidatus Bathyarchaeota archaeon]